ncbi:MAG: phage baseplate assembly protein V [Novosphingobium sp.]|nr:phage baseplate assembly protein V [Novosphingobium sp.]
MAQSNDHEQLTGEVIQVGTVASIDHAARTCTVQLGDLETGELPWVALLAGRVKLWCPPSAGEQCAVLCPEGDVDNGLVLPGIYSDANSPSTSDPDVFELEFPDGAVISYNHASHALTVALPEGGTAALTAPGGVTIEGDVAIKGNVSIEGKAEASEDVVGGGISLKGHKHTGVAAGSAQSGTPI